MPTAAGLLILPACPAPLAELGLGCVGSSLRAPNPTTELHAPCSPLRSQIRGRTAPVCYLPSWDSGPFRPFCLKLEPLLSVCPCPTLFQGLTQRAQHAGLSRSARLENNSLSSKPPRAGGLEALTSLYLQLFCCRPCLTSCPKTPAPVGAGAAEPRLRAAGPRRIYCPVCLTDTPYGMVCVSVHMLIPLVPE